MRKITKYRQPITLNGKFSRWHYWGYVGGKLEEFTSPLSSNQGKIEESYQFVGLKDKNGKEIYEGDIVKDTNGGIGVITNEEWMEIGVLPVDDKPQVYEDTASRPEKWYLFEVIGNIYENPELLN